MHIVSSVAGLIALPTIELRTLSNDVTYRMGSLVESTEGTNWLLMKRPVGTSSSRLVARMKMRAEREAMLESEWLGCAVETITVDRIACVNTYVISSKIR